MITNLNIIQLIIDLYHDSMDFDDLLYPEADAGVCMALKRIGDYDVFIVRGSETLKDFIDDGISEFWRKLHDHPQLGHVPLGFSLGMSQAYARVRQLARGKVYVGGHSLGAARALILAGMLTVDGHAPLGGAVFGCPRPGMTKLKSLIGHLPISSYRNKGRNFLDKVTAVPTDPPFTHPYEFIDICERPMAGDPWGTFAAHHIELYLDGLRALNPSEGATYPAA